MQVFLFEKEAVVTDCIETPGGLFCRAPSDWDSCRPWDLTELPNENCYIDDVVTEAVQRAGAKLNVYKLLGIHEQTKLVDITGNGNAISGGNATGFPASNAFTNISNEWRSRQSGSAALLASAYIGYDFGYVKIPSGRQRYGVDANIREQVTAIKIKQSANPLYRVTKARVERSDNGTEWYGVAIVTLPNDDKLNTIHFKHSVPNRYWRLRPLVTTGADCDVWGVQALEMYDFSVTDISNIQDKILFENRDRDYASAPLQLKGYYDLINVQTDLSRFGIEIPTSAYIIKIPFSTAVALLGRPVVIGDIIELPSETQYGPDLQPVKRYVEVTDVTWDASTYTPGWRPTMLLVTTQPAMATQETQDVFGSLVKHVDSSGLFDIDDGNNAVYQDFSAIDQTIQADAKTAVPERGSEGSNVVREFSTDEIDAANAQGFPHISKMGFNRVGLYVEDAMPQNNAPYTEGPTFPTNPATGAYHRLTYVGLAKSVPPRLHRWSDVKNRWIYLETDRRMQYDGQQPVLNEYLTSNTKTSARNIK